MKATVEKLRMELDERRESLSPPVSPLDWRQETSDLLEQIQRECNAAFARGRHRRKSPRTVFLHPTRPNDENRDTLADFQAEENWQMNDTDNATASQLSHLDFDLSKLAETEEIINGL